MSTICTPSGREASQGGPEALQCPLPSNLGRCVLIPDFLSPAECRELIGNAEKRGFSSAELDYPPSYRNNDRQVLDDSTLAGWLLDRLHQVVDGTASLLPDDIAADWTLQGINERLRLCRYRPGQRFHIHQDGVHHRGADCRSMLTFMIYLTDGDDFEGGDTVFYSQGPSDGEDESNLVARVRPRIGSLILFDHGIWHAGEEVTGGIKYVLRSDLLFQRRPTARREAGFVSPRHQGYIWTLAELADGRVASGGRDGKIRIWHSGGELGATLAGHSQSVLGLVECQPGVIASISRDRTLRCWDVATQRCIRSVAAHDAAVLSLIGLPGRGLVTGGADHRLCLWSEEGERLKAWAGHDGWVWAMARLNENMLASASEDASVKIWNLKTQACLHTLRLAHPLRTIASHRPKGADGCLLAAGDAKGNVAIWQVGNGHITELRRFKAHGAAIRRIRYLRDGSLATCGEDNRLRLWNGKTLDIIGEENRDNFVTDVLALDDGTRVSCGYDGELRWT